MSSTVLDQVVSFTNLLWLALAAVWAVAAPFAKKIVFQESLLTWAAQMAAFVLALCLILGPGKWPEWLNQAGFTVEAPISMLGACLATSGIGVCAWARLVLGRNWSSSSAIKHDHELIRGGPYRYVRHPIYTGLSIAVVGSALEHGLLRSFLGVAICLIGFWLRIRAEEHLMLKQFGTEYVSYRHEVPAIVPYVL